MKYSIFLFAVLLGFASRAQALASVPFTLSGAAPVVQDVAGGGWKLAAGNGISASGRLITRIPSGISAADQLIIAGRAGPLSVTATQSVGLADAAAVVARCLGNPLCIAATAGVAWAGYKLYQHYRMKPDGSGGMVADDGQAQETVASVVCHDSGAGFIGNGYSAVEACGGAVAQLNAANAGYGFQGSQPSSSGSHCFQRRVYTLDGTNNGSILGINVQVTGGGDNSSCTLNIAAARWGSGTYSASTTTRCPAVVDFSDPAYSAPGGPSGADGLCPTGRYQAIAPEVAGARVAANPPAVGSVDSDGLVQAVKDTVAQGQTMPSTISVSGPATQVGTPVTTTTETSAGTKTETVTPTYTYNYAGDTVSYTTTTTNITNNAGSTTTTTTTQAPPTTQDPTDPCTANPDRVGCQTLGTPPASESLPRSDAPISYSPVSFTNSASCPADIPVSMGVFGTFLISYGPLCSWASLVAPIFIALASITATIIFMSALKI